MRDAERTRAAILDAAQEAFSTRGYTGTGVREITAAAGVNAALINRYFGSKEKLYEEALADLLDSSVLTHASPDQFGEAMVELLTPSPPLRRNPLPMLLLASADPGARAISMRLLRDLTMAPLIAWFGKEGGEGRAARLVVLASGLTVYREIYPLDPLTNPLDPATRAWLVRTFQSVLDGP